MKTHWLHLLTLGAILILLQAPGDVESKKIKKIVKDAAKLSKKYGYLLASRKKKLYAVPFPMPLPVFIKRQQIYTQIPIIPRYVQHPQPYGTPAAAHQTESAAYEPMASSQTSPSYTEIASDLESHRPRSKKSAPTASYQHEGSSQASSQTSSSSSSSASSSGSNKYLSQLASIIGQSVPVFGQPSAKTNRDLVTKLLNGQAKILPPSSLISAIKGPSSALLKYQKLHQLQQESGGANSKDQRDQESNYESQSSDGGQQQNSQSANSETTKTPSESSETARPSASELHRTRHRLGQTLPRYTTTAAHSEQRLRVPMAAMLQASSMMSPFAAMATGQVPGLMSRVPMNQLAAANQYLAMLDSAQMNQLDQMDSQSSEPNELTLASSGQAAANNGDEQSGPSEDQNQIIEQRRQRLLKLALLKERLEAERLLEARMILARAKQIGQQVNKQLPVSQQQTAQLINYYKQRQIAQQLQQMRYLQLLQQQQQQLQQNSIDK